MIDLKKELKALKLKATQLMSLGDLAAYFNALTEINNVQLKLVSVRK